MDRIPCGWCGHVTSQDATCPDCGRDPVTAWMQRGQTPPVLHEDEGRPPLSASDIRTRYATARAAVVARGRTPTVESIAEELDRSPRTVRDWRKRFSLT